MTLRTRNAPIHPERLRRIDKRGFAFVPNRFLHEGFFASLTHTERSLYFFLVLASDRNGISYYSYDRICSTLHMTPDDFVLVRNSLIHKDLVAFDGTCFQVLALPPRPIPHPGAPLRSREDYELNDPATISQLIRTSLDER